MAYYCLVEPVRAYILDFKGSNKHALTVIESVKVFDPVLDTRAAAIGKDWCWVCDGGKYQSTRIHC